MFDPTWSTEIGTTGSLAAGAFDVLITATAAAAAGWRFVIFVNATTDFALLSANLTPQGALVHLPLSGNGGLTKLDSSSNKLDALCTTTGVTDVLPERRAVIRPGTLTFTSPGTLNLQLFGASVVDTTKRWRIAYVGGVSNASVNLSLGSASAGTQYVNAQAVTAAAFDIGTFVSRVISGANLWLASSNTATITELVVVLEQVG
jgi:hypothetical protein